MKPSHIDHIGIAVKSIKEAGKFFEQVLGLECMHTEEIPRLKAKIALYIIGDTRIELLESSGKDSIIGRFIEKRGEGIHHIGLAVDDVNKALKEAENNSIELIDKTARDGACVQKIGFLHPKSTFGVLFEFCGEK